MQINQSDTWETADEFLIEFANRIMSFQVCGGFVENGGKVEDGYQFCIFKSVLGENLNDDFKRKIPVFGI